MANIPRCNRPSHSGSAIMASGIAVAATRFNSSLASIHTAEIVFPIRASREFRAQGYRIHRR